MTSRDLLVRQLPQGSYLLKPWLRGRHSFKPHQEVVEIMCRDPGAKTTAALAKEMVLEGDMQICLDPCRRLSVQGERAWHFQDRAA